MRRQKPKIRRNSSLDVSGSCKNSYLTRELTSDSLYSFKEIQENDLGLCDTEDQLWEVTEDLLPEERECKLHRNKCRPDVTIFSRNAVSNEFKASRGYNLQGANFEDVEDEERTFDLVSFSSNVASEAVSSEFKRQTSGGNRLQSNTFGDDKQQANNSKHFAKSHNENNQPTGALPVLKNSQQNKPRNLGEKKQLAKGKEPKRHDSNMGIVSGKKLSYSLPPKFCNLRHFLPLPTLSQYADYDSAVIEAVRDYNDPCRGATTRIFSPY